MDIRVEMSGSFEEAGRRILDAEKQRWESAAQHIESTVRCAEHGLAPTTSLVDTPEGWRVDLKGCCESLLSRAREVFEEEISRTRA